MATAPQADPAPADAPVTPEEIVRRGMTAGGKRLIEFAVDLATGRVSFTYDTADRGQSSAASTPPLPPLSELAREILQVLEESPGEWLKGPEIAARISDDVDAAGGTFQRAAAELRRADLIESQTRNGYKLK